MIVLNFEDVTLYNQDRGQIDHHEFQYLVSIERSVVVYEVKCVKSNHRSTRMK